MLLNPHRFAGAGVSDPWSDVTLLLNRRSGEPYRYEQLRNNARVCRDSEQKHCAVQIRNRIVQDRRG